MNWYAISLLFRSEHSPSISPDLEVWEEAIVVVQAESEDVAREKGGRLAREREVSYETMSGDIATWRFERIGGVCAIETITDGIEVFTRFLKRSEVESLARGIE